MDSPADHLPGTDEENLVPESDGLAADVPAGAAGADTGAVGAARIDPDDEARVQGISSQNDLPGVGTRDADGEREHGGDGGSTSRHTEDVETADADDHTVDESAEKTPASPAPGDEGPEPHVDADDPIAKFQPGVGRDSAASSRIAQTLPDPDRA